MSAVLVLGLLAGCGGGSSGGGTVGGSTGSGSSSGDSGSSGSGGSGSGGSGSGGSGSSSGDSGGSGSGGSGSSGDDSGSRSSIEFPATLTTDEILDLDQLDGQPQWVANAETRLERGTWKFDRSGSATFSTVDVRDDVYPLRGSYRVSGSTLSFEVEGSSSSSVGGAQASMDGSVDLSQSPPEMTLTWISGNVLAANVNDTQFGGGSSAGYQATLAVDVSS